MMIDFETLEEEKIFNMRGGEGAAKVAKFSDGQVKIMKITLDQGCSIGLHKHETNCEVIYAIKGEAVCLLDGTEETIHAGQCHYCPCGSEHSVKNFQKDPFVMFAVIPESRKIS